MHMGRKRKGGIRSKKLSHKNAINHKKGPLDFLTIPSILNFAKTPGTPLNFQQLCIYDSRYSRESFVKWF
jgi:hypothetical protein